MFNRETCKVCGTCLSKCPFLEISRKDAQKEMALLIQGKGSREILNSCAGCTYCDVICPTQSNPSHLRSEMRISKNRNNGVSGLMLMSEKIPMNLMKMGLEFEKEEKLKKLKGYSKAADSKAFFYLGCSLSYIYTDLAETEILNDLPVIGGMAYCCGGYIRTQFGEKESVTYGRQLLEKLKNIGAEKLISFCPECDYMISDYYPRLIPEFDIESTNIVGYLLEEHANGRIIFNNPLNQKVTFHDSCAWRKMESKFHENPRRLLECMGAEVVEMMHNRRESTCCGMPLVGRNPQLASNISEKRVLEAKEAGAQTIAIGCTGCFGLFDKAVEHGLSIYSITELAQIALGEKPRHRIGEIRSQLSNTIFHNINEKPDQFRQRYAIKDGEIDTC